MYPDEELIRLAGYKNRLQRRIQLHRAECAVAVAGAVRPLEWLDRVVNWWRRIAPIAKVGAIPMAFILKKTVFRRAKILGTLLRWGPLAFRAVQSFRRAA
jgi:hypothetical protein